MMYKRFIVTVLVLIIILMILVLSSGCAIQQQTIKKLNQQNSARSAVLGMDEDFEVEANTVEEVKEVPVEQDIVDETTSKSEPTPKSELEQADEDTDTYSIESLSKEEQMKIKLVRSLLDDAKKSEENYFFRYSAPRILQTDVWVKGDIVKRAIIRPDEVDKFNTYNMVYLNQVTLKAEAYCETTKAKCWKGHGPFPEAYSKWDIKTPKEWVLDIEDNFRWVLDNRIAGQLYHIIDYEKDGQTIRVFVNDYKGWPGRVEVYDEVGIDINSITFNDAKEIYIYNDMDINGVSDDDVTPGR